MGQSGQIDPKRRRKVLTRRRRQRVVLIVGAVAAFIAFINDSKTISCGAAEVANLRSELPFCGLSVDVQAQRVDQILNQFIAFKIAGGPAPSKAEIAAKKAEIEKTVRDFATNATSAEERALALIGEGMREQGFAILKDEASEATREVVTRWRRIGELARSFESDKASTTTALAAYEKGVALDQSNPWDSIYLGRLYRQAGNLPKSRTTFEAALTRLPEGAERDRMVLFNENGDVLRDSGLLAEALANFEGGKVVAEKLVETSPDNTEWQRDLSVSHNKIGDVLRDQGDLAGALQAYRARHAIAERLAADDPSHAGWQRDVIVSYAKLGGMDPGAGWWAKALAVAEEMVAKGILAPTDAWMLDDLRKKAAEDAGK